MIYWIIIAQTVDDIRAIFMTTSYKKAIKKIEQLESKIDEDDCMYFYLNSLKLGRLYKKQDKEVDEDVD